MRGAEVVEVRDEEGGLMNDFTGRVRIEDRKPPKGGLGCRVGARYWPRVCMCVCVC